MTPDVKTAVQLLATKPTRDLITTRAEATAQEACRLMREHRIGCLLVTDAAGRIEGIFTERDVVNRLVAEGKDATRTLVGDLMTREVIVVEPDRTLDEVEAIMKQHRIRHLPVAGQEALLGLLSIGDVTAHHAAASKQMVHYLTEYIYGRY
jgi:CBS domain-containing protein